MAATSPIYSPRRIWPGGDTALLVDSARLWGYAAADGAGATIGIIHDGRPPRLELERMVRPKFGLAKARRAVRNRHQRCLMRRRQVEELDRPPHPAETALTDLKHGLPR